MAAFRWLATALCLTIGFAPPAWAQEEDPEMPALEEGEEGLDLPSGEEAPSMSPAELKKQLQGLKSSGGGMAGVQELARIARAIKANGGKMSLQDVQSLRTTLTQIRKTGASSQNPLYSDMMDQLDGALGRLEKQIANPDGWADEEMPTE